MHRKRWSKDVVASHSRIHIVRCQVLCVITMCVCVSHICLLKLLGCDVPAAMCDHDVYVFVLHLYTCVQIYRKEDESDKYKASQSDKEKQLKAQVSTTHTHTNSHHAAT